MRDNWLMPELVVRASYSKRTIRVYQAYRPEIALPALAGGRFVQPFKMGRMTWIKPSFNWIMHRSGYATKPGQEVVLGIDITREGFEWALENAALSSFTPAVHSSFEEWQRLLAAKPVRVQWDPERDCHLNIIKGLWAIQIGLSGEAVERYVHQWIVSIQDMTGIARQLAADVDRGGPAKTLPNWIETDYPLSPALRRKLCVE